MNVKPIHIGIIGGMGPQASVRLHKQILERFTESQNNTNGHDFPMITHISIPVEDFVSNLDLKQRSLHLFQHARKTLMDGNVDIAVIACNTAHLLLDDLPELRKLPLISLPEQTIIKVKEMGICKVGVLASPTSISTNLFETFVANLGIDLLIPNQEQLKDIEKIIRKTISGCNSTQDADRIVLIASKLIDRGAEVVILGCTELSIVMKEYDKKQFIDSLDVAAEAIFVESEHIRKTR